MLHKFQYPLLLIAGMTNAVQLDLPCETEANDCCAEAGCDNGNAVDINIDFNVQAKQDHHHHDLDAIPSALEDALNAITDQLDEAEQELAIQNAVDEALRIAAAAEKLRFENLPEPEPVIVIEEKIIDQTLVVTETVVETVRDILTLTDATELSNGDSWLEFRDEAMSDGFLASDVFIALSAEDQELAIALIQYELAKEVIVYNISEIQTSTDLSMLTRNTLIDGETWATYRGNSAATAYSDLSLEDQITVTALTRIQTVEDALGREFANPSGTDMREFTATVTTYTRTGPIGDDTQIAEAAASWAQFKIQQNAMSGFFQSSTNYNEFSASTRALIDALILTQSALGVGFEDAELLYGESTTIETRQAVYEEVCPLPDTECGVNPFATLISKIDDTDETNSCQSALFSAYEDRYLLDYPTFESKWTQMCNSYRGVQSAVETDGSEVLWRNAEMFNYVVTGFNNERGGPSFDVPGTIPEDLAGLYFQTCPIVTWGQYEEILNKTYYYRQSIGAEPPTTTTGFFERPDDSECSPAAVEWLDRIEAEYNEGVEFADYWDSNNIPKFRNFIVNVIRFGFD